MLYSEIFKNRINCDSGEEVFDYLISTLKETIKKWDYFVNWNKVFDNLRDIEEDLKILNRLIGEDNIKAGFTRLLQERPSVSGVVPILAASRDENCRILSEYGYDAFVYEDFSFQRKKSLTPGEIEKIARFAEESGFLKLLASKRIRNVVDYVTGVEVGLDSNGRKNRIGRLMENIVEFFVKDLCGRNSYDYVCQANAAKVKRKWGLNLTVDKSSRNIDFAIYNGKSLYLIEANFYGGGGSKLKSTAGEYRTMFDYWKNDGHKFIWVTDGIGWRSAYRPLRETFDYTDYLLNLEMVSRKVLEDIITGNL